MHNRRIKYFATLSDQETVALLLANNAEAVEYVFFYRCKALFAHVINSVMKDCEKPEELIGELYLFLQDNDWAKLRQFEFNSSLNVETTITKAGLANLSIFSKLKNVEYSGKGQYTVDLSKIDEDVVFEYTVQIMDEEFNLSLLTIKAPEGTFEIDFDA